MITQGLGIQFVFISMHDRNHHRPSPRGACEKGGRGSEKRGFPSRSEAFRTIVEYYLREHPELFLDTELEILLGDQLSDRRLERLGAKLFSGTKVSRLVGEARRR